MSVMDGGLYFSPEDPEILLLNMTFEAFVLKIFLRCSTFLHLDDFRNDEGYWLKIRTRARRFSKISIFFNLFHLKKSSEKLAFNLSLFSKK